MASKTLTDKRYIGKVCGKHPDFGGLRRKCDDRCVECVAVKVAKSMARSYADPDTKEIMKARHREWCHQNLDKVAEQASKWLAANPGVANAIVGKRRAAKIQRTPAWADLEKIKQIYLLAAELGMTVDHIIPLQGELVSGLHVHINLQLLTSSENSAKGNKFHG